MIFLPAVHNQMKHYRNMARRAWGDRYEKRVLPYRSLMIMHARRNPQKDPIQLAQELIGHIRARGKWSNTIQAALFAATIDVIEMKSI